MAVCDRCLESHDADAVAWTQELPGGADAVCVLCGAPAGRLVAGPLPVVAGELEIDLTGPVARVAVLGALSTDGVARITREVAALHLDVRPFVIDLRGLGVLAPAEQAALDAAIGVILAGGGQVGIVPPERWPARFTGAADPSVRADPGADETEAVLVVDHDLEVVVRRLLDNVGD